MKRRALLASIASIAAIGAARGAAAQSLEILTLRHRRADEVLPLLQPFVAPGGVINGQGYQLFVRTTPGNLAELQRLLAQIDRAPRQLMITVRQDVDGRSDQQQLGADGSVIVTERGPRGTVTIESRNSRSITTRGTNQSIRVSEGSSAYIAIGRAIPMAFRQWVPTRSGVTEVQGTVWMDAITGFYARPSVGGDQVSIELSPQDMRETSSGTRLATTVQGRLGEWIAVGGVGVDERSDSRGMLSSGSRGETSQRGVWLKVDEVPN